MDSKTEKKSLIETQEPQSSSKNSNNLEKVKIKLKDVEIENFCDENLTTLQKIHAILLNCSNLSKKHKLEFCESERYFMKLYLKKLKANNNNL
ncbi:MAG: hypothetical protein HWN81_02365 [Candidatus Lokiarchaeota archaeon]|nr:hypothetical protein [Candidatus Lokiarchaeota archaeon]